MVNSVSALVAVPPDKGIVVVPSSKLAATTLPRSQSEPTSAKVDSAKSLTRSATLDGKRPPALSEVFEHSDDVPIVRMNSRVNVHTMSPTSKDYLNHHDEDELDI